MVVNKTANEVSAMQVGLPFKSYKKVCVPRIYVRVMNTYTGNPEDLILKGNPFAHKINLDKIVVDVWSESEDSFFRKMNRYHLEKGNIIEYDRSVEKEEEEKEKNFNIMTDEEIEELLMSKFFSIKYALKKMTSTAILFRVLSKARDLEKSEKIINLIEARLTFVQSDEEEEAESED